MDVRLPDGTVVQNVPDGTTKAQLVEKLSAKGYDTSWYKTEAKAEEPAKSGPLPVNAGLANLAASTLGIPVDTIEGALNLADRVKRAVGGNTNAALYGGDRLRKSVGGSEWIKEQLRRTGEPGLNPDNPNPNDPTAKAQYDFTSRGGVIPGGALPALASMGAEAIGGPDWAAVGALTPQALSRGGAAAKSALANPKTVQENIDTFKKVGATPDVAQATDSNFWRGLTNVAARIPGGQGVIAKFREKEQETLGNAAKTGTTAESGGRAIKEGITGDGGFIDRTKAQWQKLDNEVAAKIPKGSAFAPANTVKALDDLTTPTVGAEKTTGALVNPKLAEIKANMAADLQANNGQMPFEALRSLRSKVGSMLDDSLVTGIPNGELKRLYAGLSKDLEAAANQSGAGAAFARQSNYYKARMERIENTLDSVLGKGKEPEAIFKAVSPTDVDSVNKLRRVMRSLDDDERQVVSNAVVNRLGRASPGKQDVTGAKFSSETFLTNWSRINDSSKAQLFPDPAMRSKLDAIAKVSADIRDGKAPFGNPSGTGQAMTAGSVYGAVPAAAALAVTGNIPAAVTSLAIAGSLVASANIGARMLTSPKVVDWLAKTAKVTTPERMTAQLGQLGVIYNETKDQELKQELGNYLKSVSASQAQK